MSSTIFEPFPHTSERDSPSHARRQASCGDAGLIRSAACILSAAAGRADAQSALKRSEACNRALAETSSEGVLVIDAAGAILYCNQRLLDMIGCSRGELMGLPIGEVAGLESLIDLLSARSDAGSRPHSASCIRRSDGTQLWVSSTTHEFLDEQGRSAGLLVMLADAGNRRQADETLGGQALFDSLTGLPNRELLQERLAGGVLSAGRDSGSLALLLLDVDHFKEVNAAFGHSCGDVLLQQIARRLQAVSGDSTTVARLGGDEFAVILPGSRPEEAVAVARKLLTALADPFQVEQQRLEIDASVGLAMYPDHATDSQTVLQRAEIAMYRAKRSRSGYSVYARQDEQPASGRFVVTGELRQAIDRGDLELFFQPKLDMARGQFVGTEALLRWHHPRHGLILPDQFVPLAERTNLISPLTEWVIRAALQQCEAWHEKGWPISVAVNLSMQNLRDRELPGVITRLLAERHVPLGALKFEITESAIMADPEQTMEVVSLLHQLGASFCIDDFGTGYSSLAYLKALPVQEIKIDKSFVLDLLTDESGAVIVRSVIDLAHNLGKTVTAEGVENAGIWDALVSLGCDVAQGYHIGRPMPAADFERWLQGSAWEAPTASAAAA